MMERMSSTPEWRAGFDWGPVEREDSRGVRVLERAESDSGERTMSSEPSSLSCSFNSSIFFLMVRRLAVLMERYVVCGTTFGREAGAAGGACAELFSPGTYRPEPHGSAPAGSGGACWPSVAP